MDYKNKKLYLEGSSGISGDMFVAALLDLGANQEKLNSVLKSLSVKGFEISISRVQKSGLDACDFMVELDAEHENHDHDMAYLTASDDIEVHTHHEHFDHDNHHHVHEHHHTHEHRALPDIIKILEQADMSERARIIAKKIFMIIGDAEAKAHGLPIDQVHFHEVGAVDSIVDIVAAAVCIDDLNISEVIIPKLNEGQGMIRCQHGMLPVPVPAVSNIVASSHLNLHIMPYEGEFVTPTGAAIAAAIMTSDQLPENFQIVKTGLGAGKREYKIPSILRIFLIEEHSKTDNKEDKICKLECNMDDITGENLGYTSEKLYEAGALDVSFLPIYMKKNRPAYLLEVMCNPSHRNQMEDIIFRETTTIGIRRQLMDRTILPRSQEKIQTPYGEVSVKICTLPSGEEKKSPEYEDIRKIAREHNISYKLASETVLNIIHHNI